MTSPPFLRRFKQLLQEAYLDINEYRLIYFEGNRNLDVLNAVAGSFFNRLQNVYRVNFVLSASRFLDASRTAGKENYSLAYLLEFAQAENLPFVQELTSLVARAKDTGPNVKLVRDKILSHHAASFYGKDDDHTVSLELEEIEAVLGVVAKSLNLFHKHYEGHSVSYADTLGARNGALSLMHYLKESLVYEEMKKRRNAPEMDRKEWEISKWRDA